ncbi:hypothetical protein [Aquimarina megaterium]|uniref:hypothetical protein n=1 Tax=Aquimarina megaterium TaxID=1443666 RepID=UPI000470DAAA|nr:hypothetical protein [Aquimarina megaterium]
MRYILFITFLLTICCNGQVENEMVKEKEIYNIVSIDSTNRYYLYKVFDSKKDDVLLVIDKNSKQLEDKNISINKTYSFQTYKFYDIFSFDANMCHYVDGVKIWCHSDKVDLRFTDGMGNDIIEN